MDGYALFNAVNKAAILKNCDAHSYITKQGVPRESYTEKNSTTPCAATFICRYPRSRVLEIGQEILIAVGIPEHEHPRLLEELGAIYDQENRPEHIGCKGSKEQVRTFNRNIAIGVGALAAVGVGSYFLFFRN